MIQFNLLPDVKQQYAKAVYRRRMISLACFIVGGAFLIIFILMFLFVRVNQTRHLANLDKDIKSGVSKLQENKDLDKVLTIQNQLGSLPQLHDKKVIVSRLFEYLGQITPNDATVSDVELDVETKKLNIKGTAIDFITVNKFLDTLKFTTYKVEGATPKEGNAFTSVVLQTFNLSPEDQGGTSGSKVSYQINFVYDEAIFMNTATEGDPLASSVKLTIPKIITTRSETQKPTELFQSTETPGGEQ